MLAKIKVKLKVLLKVFIVDSCHRNFYAVKISLTTFKRTIRLAYRNHNTTYEAKISSIYDSNHIWYQGYL